MDDSLTARNLLKRALKNSTYEVVAEANSGEMAITEYKRCLPDVVTMDLDMPGIGGIEAAKSIVSIDKNAKIIIVTAHESNDLSQIAAENGLKYTVNKPVTEENVLSTLEKILSDKGVEQSQSIGENKDKESDNPKESDDRSVENEITRDLDTEFDVIGEQSKELSNDQPVIVSHFSRLKSFKGIIQAMGDNTLTIKVELGINVVNFFENDPIMIGFKNKDDYCVCGYKILTMNTKDRTILVRYNTLFNISSRGSYDQLPVSIAVDIKASGQNRKNTAVIRGLSLNNMVILSKLELSTDTDLEFYMPMFENLTYIKTAVVEKHKATSYFEYHIKIIYSSIDNKQNVMKWFISALKEQYIKDLNELVD